jgi:curved DNA-binding protein CbpA
MKSRKPEGMSEDQFSFELENLYKEIGHPERLDAPQVGAEPDLSPYYEIFKVPPDVTHEELKLAYERLAAAWAPERFADHPEWKEKAEIKLNKINKAYETILSARIREIKAIRKQRKPVDLAEIEKEPETEDMEADYEEQGSASRFGFKKIALYAGIPIFLLFCYFIIAPLFDRPSERGARKDNLPQAVSKPAVPSAEVTPAPPPRPPVDLTRPTASPDKTVQGGVQSQVVQPVEKAVPAPEPRAKEVRPEVKQAPPSAQNREPVAKPISKAPVKEPVRSPAASNLPFSIQVGAVKDKAKAEDYLGKIRKDGLKPSLLQTTLPSGEKGFRILVGRFASREEALDFMNKNNIKEKYPGSFIQNISP